MTRIKQLRLEKGFSQADVSLMLNMTRQGYANYENELTQPTPSVLIKLADIFGCSIDYLVGREDDFGVILGDTSLTQSETELLRIYRRQNEQNKKYLLTFAKGLDTF